MLPDFERKLLRIMYNFFAQHRRMPTSGEWTNKTGKRAQDITEGLLYLEREHYISWENKASVQGIVMLEAWERTATKSQSYGSRSDTTPASVKDGTEYWTSY